MRKGTKMVMKKMTNKMMAKPNTIAKWLYGPLRWPLTKQMHIATTITTRGHDADKRRKKMM